ncbi:hypothetical protein D3C71_2188000 [compost metagenome]
MTQFIRRGEEAVAHAGTFFLIADLLINIRQQVLGLAVFGFGVHQFIENLIGFAVLALIKQGFPLGHDLVCATHHFYI